MAIEATSGIPGIVESGDTLLIAETFTDYPEPDYTISLFLSPATGGNATANASGTGNGTNWEFTFSAATTTNITPGDYFYSYRATETATNRVKTIGTGTVTFIANLAGTVVKSTAEQMLEALNEAILTLSAGTSASTSFNGQSVTKKDLARLMESRRELQAEVAREKRLQANLRGEDNSGNIAPNFGPGQGWPFHPYGCNQ